MGNTMGSGMLGAAFLASPAALFFAYQSNRLPYILETGGGKERRSGEIRMLQLLLNKEADQELVESVHRATVETAAWYYFLLGGIVGVCSFCSLLVVIADPWPELFNLCIAGLPLPGIPWVLRVFWQLGREREKNRG